MGESKDKVVDSTLRGPIFSIAFAGSAFLLTISQARRPVGLAVAGCRYDSVGTTIVPIRSDSSHLFDRNVRRKPRLVGGVKGHNIK